MVEIISYRVNDQYHEAVKHYSDYCKNNGIAFQQPSKDGSLNGRKYVHLSNSNGLIVKYLIKEKQLLFPNGTLVQTRTELNKLSERQENDDPTLTKDDVLKLNELSIKNLDNLVRINIRKF